MDACASNACFSMRMKRNRKKQEKTFLCFIYKLFYAVAVGVVLSHISISFGVDFSVWNMKKL
jgi:predicted nucleic acid-binding Zn ribbon protein